ncbi:MAG: prepilin-type N-terminal cleavage/methylation domain-containing protein [Candidatus Uhrbacteria bacterium]|nr:prepilin-type N-terminal cleavage/methylation domain-containing protein [Candidatus Uhrbacteria bacterium]
MSTSALRRGFTILEILIVILVFALLATLAILSLRSSRLRLRDAQRISDVTILRTALSQFWLEKASYPASGGVNLGQPGTNTEVFTAEGFAAAREAKPPIYLPRVPIGPKLNEYYRYRGAADGYSIRFQTESETTLGKANVYYAHASGIDQKDEEK